MRQKTLFNEPRLRKSNGRYCTQEQFKTEHVESENKYLRLERDKYYRMAMALSRDNERLTRELEVLRSKIENLL